MAEELARNIEWTELNWLNKRQGKSLPYRADFLEVNGDFQFLLERDDEGIVRLRHVGLYFESLFGASLAGREFETLFSNGEKTVFHADMNQLFNEPSKLYVHTLSPALEIQFGLFPVSEDYGPVNYAIGAVNLEEIPKTNVHLLDIVDVEIVSLRAKQKELRYGFAEDSAGFSGAPRSRFRLIEGGAHHSEPARPGLQVIHNVKREP